MRVVSMIGAVIVVGLSATAACDKKSEAGRSQLPAGTSAGSGAGNPASLAPASTLPKTDPERLTALTKKVLTFCQNKDVEALVLMVPERERESAKKSFAPGEANYESYFGASSWRWQAVRDWDDDVQEVRVKGDLARAKFANADDKTAAVVELARIDGIWSFKGLENPTLAEYASWGESAK